MNKQQKIRSFADLEYITGRCKRILTLLSGGLDSSYVLSELAKYEHCEIIALTIDMGEGVEREDLANIAGHFGARSIVIDGRESLPGRRYCQPCAVMRNTWGCTRSVPLCPGR
ncbi:argininosuccinate synthase [Salmonella enterica subsp. diarizonae]|uniref:Argininosuccinate synthase n=1 Tax=Salmonella diarizonae TaxID=59204 RepID=A0A379U0L2_SALDZ|nr:argininosuccinate synthase [Salmonella enterica subsp. diarizonae]